MDTKSDIERRKEEHMEELKRRHQEELELLQKNPGANIINIMPPFVGLRITIFNEESKQKFFDDFRKKQLEKKQVEAEQNLYEDSPKMN